MGARELRPNYRFRWRKKSGAESQGYPKLLYLHRCGSPGTNSDAGLLSLGLTPTPELGPMLTLELEPTLELVPALELVPTLELELVPKDNRKILFCHAGAPNVSILT